MNNQIELLESKLKELTNRLSEREASIPIHSRRPHQLIEIEELEEDIAELQRQLQAIRNKRQDD